MYLKQEHPPSVSASEIAVWKQCRQKWYWQYFLRIEPATTHTKLAQGTMAHAGIAAALGNGNVRVAVESAANDLHRSMYFHLDGEALDNFPAEDEISTVTNCVEKWNAESNKYTRKLISSEVKWEIPVRDGRRSLKGVTWNGRMDAIIETGGAAKPITWGLEAKFVGQFRSAESVELSSQLAMYLVYMREGMGFDIPKLLYVQIFNKMPAIPEANKTSGISRKAINTDWPTYHREVVRNGYNPLDYADVEEKLQDKKFWREQSIVRTTERLNEDRAALYDVTSEIMAKRKRVYMCDSPFLCPSCQFRDLCLETVRGRDPQNLIDSGAYVAREKPREEEAAENGDEN